MKYESVKINEISVCGMIVELTTSQNENFTIISQCWKNFNVQLRHKKMWQGKDWAKYGITKKIDGKYFYMTAIESAEDVAGFDNEIISAGEFMCFQHVGSLERIKLTISEIYRNVIPSLNIKLDAKNTLAHYERYDYRFNWNDPDSILDIYVPIEIES